MTEIYQNHQKILALIDRILYESPRSDMSYMRYTPSKSLIQSYLLSLSLVIFLTVSSFHILEMDTNAYACSCVLPESAKDALNDSDAVFSGKVANISGKHPDYPEASRHDPVSVTFAVDQVWKGPANSTMTVNTESSEASCGYEFQQDETYVVYAYEKENGDSNSLHTRLCSGTSLFSESYYDLNEFGTGTNTLQLENEINESKEENKIGSIVLTPFDLYFEEDDFTTQGPNHNILRLDKGDSAILNIHIKNNDDVPHHITMRDPRGVATSGTFESFSFEPEQFIVLPHQTNSTKLYLTVSNNTDTHSKFVTFLAQSNSFGMRGMGFFIVVDREIDGLVDHSMRSGLPGAAFEHLNANTSEIDAEKQIDSGFGTPRHLPQGYEFQGMDGSEDSQRLIYSTVPIVTETTGFSEFWNNGGLLIIYGIDGPNVNNTESLPFRIAQDEGQQIMINGMMGDAVEKQTRVVAESDITYDFPASISFFDDEKKKSVYLRANMQLDELLKIAASIPIYDGPDFTVEKNTSRQQGQMDYPPPRPSDIPPLKQFRSGIAIDEIQCREYFVLIIKHDDSPACVKPETKEKLIEWGWASETRVSFCLMEEDPVCGVDGKTYGNLCMLNKTHVQLYHDGRCTSHDASHENVVQPEKVIVEVVDRHYTEQVFPIRITEVTSGIADKDKIQSWFFLPIDMGEKIRDWNFVTNSMFGIVDKNGDDAIDRSVSQDFGYLNDVSRGSQITCSNDETISMKYRTPSVVEIKDNVTKTYSIHSNIGFPPSLYKNETLKIASFFDQDVVLPDHAILISNRSETCTVNHMGFTEAYYDKVVFQFTR